LSLSTFLLLLLLHVVAGWIPKLTMRKTSSLPAEWSADEWVRNVCEQALTQGLTPLLYFFVFLEFEFVDEGDRHKGPWDNLPSRLVVVVVVV
jgi:hypothetical protein